MSQDIFQDHPKIALFSYLYRTNLSIVSLSSEELTNQIVELTK